MEAYREFKREADKALEMMKANGLRIVDSDDEDAAGVDFADHASKTASEDDEDEDEDEGTGVMTSQLRHFVIQVRPISTSVARLKDRNTSPGLCYST